MKSVRAEVGWEGESGVSGECRKWVQMTKMAEEKNEHVTETWTKTVS